MILCPNETPGKYYKGRRNLIQVIFVIIITRLLNLIQVISI